MTIWNMISLQNSNNSLMEHLEFFHDHIIVILMVVTLFTFFLMISFARGGKMEKLFSENHSLELFWTSVPSVMLVGLAIPSIKILYMTDEAAYSSMTVKSTGNQWYWSYQVSSSPSSLDLEGVLDSDGVIRNLLTSSSLLLPSKSPIRVLITSNDVLHSWAVPSLGVSADATPGRLNQSFLTIKRPGVFVGQCSEICGSNHSFMPITLSVS